MFEQTVLPANSTDSVVVVYAVVKDALDAYAVVGDVVTTVDGDVRDVNDRLDLLQAQMDAEK